MALSFIREEYLLNYLTKGKFKSFTLTDQDRSGTKAMEPERRKIYIVRRNSEIWYVGEADCSIQVRMRRGFAAYRHWQKHGTKRGGYGGYKWIPEFTGKKSARVHVFVFDKKFDNKREAIEAIEGELVFLIRQRIGQWPKYQNEIHFTNSASAKKIALKIYAETQKTLALRPRRTTSEKLAIRMKLN